MTTNNTNESRSSFLNRLRGSKWLEEERLVGVIPLLVGLSLLLLLFSTSLPFETDIVFVMGGGGWLLIGIGVNALSGKDPLQGGWGSKSLDQLFTIIGVLAAILMFVLTVSVYL